jgi:Tol biopolymer transport system component
VNPDGSGGHWFAPGSGYNPQWSPDGRRLLFIRDGELWIANADGTDQTRLPIPRNARRNTYYRVLAADWSPDGSSVVVQAEFVGSEIYVFRIDGSHLVEGRQISHDWWADYWPVWSPTGMAIAYIRNTGNNSSTGYANKLVVAWPDNLAKEVLLASSTISGPSWSPDGQKLAVIYCKDPDGGTRLAVINPDGTGRTDLLQLTASRCAPDAGPSIAWSPDGTKIAFVGPSGTTLRVVNADGTNMQIVARHVESYATVSWRPLAH